MRYLLLVLLTFNLFAVEAQEPQPPVSAPEKTVDIRTLEKISNTLRDYVSKVNTLQSSVQYMTERRLKNTEENLVYIQHKWDAYTAKNMELITDERIDNISVVGEFYQSVVALKDAIEKRRVKIAALTTVEKLKDALPVYEENLNEMYEKAKRLSSVKQTEKQLETLKADAQLKYGELTQLYQSAKQSIAEDDISFASQMKSIDETYIRISALVNSIQEMKFVPFVERIKDYMISIGVVAILIMLFNIILTKIKAVKALKENMEKMNQFNQNKDIPTI